MDVLEDVLESAYWTVYSRLIWRHWFFGCDLEVT